MLIVIRCAEIYKRVAAPLRHFSLNMAYIQVANSRGGKALIIDNYRYLRNKSTVEVIYWRCAHRGCKVYLHTRWVDVDAPNPDVTVVRPPGEHDHAPEEDLVATTALIEQMLERVAADPTLPIKRVYDEAVALAPDVRHMPPFHAIKSRLERKRASLMPPIPQTVEQVAVEGEWAMTWTGDQFLSKHNQEHGFLVFGTEDNFRRLGRCDQVSQSN